MNKWLSNAAVAGALGCTIVMTVLTVRQQLRPTSRSRPPAVAAPVQDWASLIAAGHRIGTSTSAITVLVFADVQCPYCKRFAMDQWPRVREKYGDAVSMVFRHWPLPYHSMARTGAHALECAATQGRFEPMHDALFRGQAAIDTTPMRVFAATAGLTGLDVFDECMRSNRFAKQIDDDAAAAKEAGGSGTPTIVINGMRYGLRSDSLWLLRLVDSLYQDVLAAGR